MRYRVGDLVLDTGTRQVNRGNKTLKLGALTFDLLLSLVESAPDLVTYDELAEQVWQGRPVTPETITQRAKMLRDALSEDAAEPRYLESIRGRGYRLIADVESLSAETTRKPARRVIYFLAITAVALLAALYLAARLPDEDPTPSVAVLPFVDMTDSGDQQYLADGIAEELINELAGLSGLHVVSRTSSFTFRGENEDLKAIGDALGVSAVLEGSVRRSQGDIRITVQLIDVTRDKHLWSDTFDRKQEDIFAIQEEIATAVAGVLGVTLGVGGVNDFWGAGTRSFAAYEAYLKRQYELATELDPEYAAAWGRLGVGIASTMWRHPPEDAPEIIARAFPNVMRAIELDPDDSRVHATFATLSCARKDWLSAQEAFGKALALRRDRRNLVSYANCLMRTGRHRVAQVIQTQADEVERMSRGTSRLRNFLDIAQGNFDAVREVAAQMQGRRQLEANLLVALNDGSLNDLRAALEAVPSTEPAKAELWAPVLATLDSPEDVLATLKEVYADSRRMWPSKYHDIALLAAYYDDPEFALQVFSRELQYTTIRLGALWYPVMSDVRKLPEFKKFVTDLPLVEYWRTYGWADYCRPLGDDDFVCQ